MVREKRNTQKLNYGCKVYNFMQWNCLAFTLSIFLLTASLFSIAVRGFNWGLDFTGGTIIELNVVETPNLDRIRGALKRAGFANPVVQNFNSTHSVILRLPLSKNGPDQELDSKVLGIINEATDQNPFINRVECIGPSVGSGLAQDGSMALLLALICILFYVGFRFEWHLAIGAVLALVHDVFITLGALSFFHIEVDLTIIASLMSVIAYSLNDSIVVSDRIRENFRKIRNSNTYDIINISLSQTLKRTIITSATILMVVLMLLIFGGSMLHGFSTTLFIGVSIGTVSSIYVASALALRLGLNQKHLLRKQLKKESSDQLSLLP